ncbi:MAG: GntR family transcriptional regulator [Clostridiales bacterium]|nr:GntR family transcriptional regulator [Clostridiales bacterium]
MSIQHLSPLSLYFQLKESIIANILNNTWPPDTMIPSENELCKMYGVSRVTVRKALDELVQDDYIFRLQGKGTFVKRKALDQKLSKFYSFSEELKKHNMNEEAQVISFEILTAEERIQEQLNLKNDKRVIRVKRVRSVMDRPYGLESSFIPYSLIPGLTREKVSSDGLYNSLREAGLYPVRARETFKAVTLHNPIAKLLKAKTGDAAIYLTRNAYLHHNVPIEFCESIILGSVFSYTIELS